MNELQEKMLKDAEFTIRWADQRIAEYAIFTETKEPTSFEKGTQEATIRQRDNAILIRDRMLGKTKQLAPDYSKLTRIEVIANERLLVKYVKSVDVQWQDNNQTLKIFVTE